MNKKPTVGEYREIAEYISNGNCVLFLGSGVSLGSDGEQGLPSASELASALVDKIKGTSSHKKAKSVRDDLSKVAEIYEVKGDKNDLDGYIKSSFEPIKTPLKFHSLVSKLPFNIIITTNYDDLLERQFDENGKSVVTIVTSEDIHRWDEQKIIILKIHGCIKNECF